MTQGGCQAIYGLLLSAQSTQRQIKGRYATASACADLNTINWDANTLGYYPDQLEIVN